MSVLTSVIDGEMLRSALVTCATVVKAPIGFISTDGSYVVKRNFPDYAEAVERALGQEFKLHRQQALSEKKSLVQYPDGTESVVAPIVLNGNLVGGVVLGPYTTGRVIVDKVSNIYSIADLEDVMKEMQKRAIGDEAAAQLIAKTIFPLLHNQKRESAEIRQLQMVKEMSKAVNSSLDVKEVMRNVVHSVKSATKAFDCSILLSDGQNFSFSGDMRKKMIEAIMLANMASSRVPMIVRNAGSDFFFSKVDVECVRGQVIIGMPLLASKSFIGVLVVYVSKELFDDAALNLISVLTEQAAAAAFNAQQHGIITKLAITDTLTELYNRNYFFGFVSKTYTNTDTYSIALLDIDDFRQYNNVYGHPAGDKLLKNVAATIRNRLGPKGIAARYGGEEFIIAVPGHDAVALRNILDNVREEAASYPTNPITLSAGLVVCKNQTLTTEEFVRKADEALYKAKSTGKNKICTTVVIHKALSEVTVD